MDDTGESQTANKCVFFIHGLSGNGGVQATAVEKALRKAQSDWSLYRCEYSSEEKAGATLVYDPRTPETDPSVDEEDGESESESEEEAEPLKNDDDIFYVARMMRAGVDNLARRVFRSILAVHVRMYPREEEEEEEERGSIELSNSSSESEEEEEDECVRRPITHLSIVGSSMGGLIARRVTKWLLDESDRHFANVEYVTLAAVATPHIGVGEGRLFSKWRLGAVARFAVSTLLHTGRDLLWRSDYLTMLADEEHIDALLQYRHRINYMPLLDDAMVTFDSTAMMNDRPASFQPEVALQKPYYYEMTPEEWTLDEALETVSHAEEIRRIHDLPLWTPIVVNAEHRPLATLYAREDRPLAGPMSEAVARHIVANLG